MKEIWKILDQELWEILKVELFLSPKFHINYEKLFWKENLIG
jgi:hypothetical protein